MKLFITATFKDKNNQKEIEQLCKIVKKAGFDDFCFIRDVENYKKKFLDSKQLMIRAKNEIINCDGLLFDATKTSTGRAIEVGIAYASKKKIIVIMKKGTKIKDTLRGVADAVIPYDEIEDIQPALIQFCRASEQTL